MYLQYLLLTKNKNKPRGEETDRWSISWPFFKDYPK